MDPRSAPVTPARVVREVRAATRRLAGRVRLTPVEEAPHLAGTETRNGGRVALKLENLQLTGSFKLRGALNRLLALSPAARRRGVVAASTGNHGLAVAAAVAEVGGRATVVVPRGVPPGKLARLRAAGIEVTVHGDDCVVAETHARRLAERTGRTFVSPYNDLLVLAGQGTVGLELARQRGPAERVYVAVGGGGLAAGVAAVLKAAWPGVEIVGCLPSNSPAMPRAVAAGRAVPVVCRPTLSDATAGGLEEGSITVPLCAALVDRFVTVGEAAIAREILAMLGERRLVVEGAAAVALAACRREQRRDPADAVVIVCGGNLPLATLRALLAAR